MNGASDINGKAPAHSNGSGSVEPLVKVQPPRREDLQPSYASTLTTPDSPENSGWYGSCIGGLGSLIGTLGAVPCCVICPNKFRSVPQGNVGLITKFGRFSRAVDPGLVVVNPLSEKLSIIDVKIQIVEVPKQVCMTKDNVNLTLTSVIYYHVTSPHKAAFGISSLRTALMERTQTTLRHVIGARVLQDVIERREEIAQSIREIIDETATGWGAAVESMLIKDIIFSQELQDSLSMAAQSKRTGEAKVITARAEVESAKLMRRAADILSSAPAMQIRYLEAMQAMAKTSGSKVIFMPGPGTAAANLQQSVDFVEQVGEGPSRYQEAGAGNESEFSSADLQNTMSARVVESM